MRRSAPPSLTLFAALLLSGGAWAGPENALLKKVREELQALNELAALKTLEQAREQAKNSPDDLAWVHLYTGLAHAGLADKPKAVKSFQTALVLLPDIALPTWVSPVVRNWWVEAGGVVPAAADTPRVQQPRTLEPPFQRPEEVKPDPGQKGWKTTRWVGVGLSAGAVALVTTGFIQGKRASNLAAQAQAQPDLSAGLTLRRQAESTATSANVLFAVSGALAAAGVLTWVW